MLTLEQWRKMLEMGGATDAIVGRCPGPNADYQVQGALCDRSAKKSKVKDAKMKKMKKR